ncbi:MAG: RNA-binding transcriptional accessory protein [Gammaproteobacteria bacterium]|nr:MAG: RNA-binding transcriptional accessory protein [Gammaproteobacteria bacterium]
MSLQIVERIAQEVSAQPKQIAAAIALLDEGATVPFIARYRKEATGALDDSQLRTIEERLRYLRELEDRKQAILASIREQGKLTEELEAAIHNADNKSSLEDLYLPYKPKRQTKGQKALAAGLGPLADKLLAHPELDPAHTALDFVNDEAGVPTVDAALEGARYILMERFAEHAPLLSELRQMLWQDGWVVAQVLEGQQKNGQKFRDYFDYKEAIRTIPSHRALALFRARNEGVIKLSLVSHDPARDLSEDPALAVIRKHTGVHHCGRPADDWLAQVIQWTWRVKLHLHLETDLFRQLKEQAEDAAIAVFAANLRDLLMAPPAGHKTTLGIDPGLRTGIKVVVVDGTGKLLHNSTLFPHAPQNQWDASRQRLAALIEQFRVELVSIGNGTACRETERLLREVAKATKQPFSTVVVNEAGASVYSASALAAEEFPNLDVTYRGAVSIARRLQDPLAELVKIDPKSIGVGQYQHDVSQVKLSRALDAVVEDCVNAVGVDLNTASIPLLTRVSGLSKTLAETIVKHREANGPYRSRQQLLDIPRLGPKAFQLCAGFLRIRDGEHPLDASAVHPESYELVEKMAAKLGVDVSALVGHADLVRQLKVEDFVDEQFGEHTVRDVLMELEKPGRDPRPEFRTVAYREGVESITDLEPGMTLEGVVSNVTDFGAFVDIGVHQDGLVHISELSDHFVRDPREVVKAGDIVQVRVLEVDQERHRIALSMRSQTDTRPSKAHTPKSKTTPRRRHSSPRKSSTPGNSALADALAAALANKKERQ